MRPRSSFTSMTSALTSVSLATLISCHIRSPIAAQRFTYRPRTGFGVATSGIAGRRIESGTTTVARAATLSCGVAVPSGLGAPSGRARSDPVQAPMSAARPLEQIVQGRPLASEQGEPTVIVGVARVPLGECDALVQRTERGAADIGVEAMERDRQCCNALHESVDRRRDVGQHLTLDL